MKTTTPTTPTRQESWNGMNWIRQAKRVGIYLRDGMACCYCGATVEDGAQLSLDHITPHSHGGTNEATNLVTCCSRCNSSRGNRPVATFAVAVAEYLNHGVTAQAIIDHVYTTSQRPVPMAEAKELIARRRALAK